MRARPLFPKPAWLVMALALTSTCLCAQGVTLDQLIELAKQRAATQRPLLEAKLAPYRETLQTPYKDNWVVIEEKAVKIIALGDSIVPMLLENLEPTTASPANLNLAANSARLLSKMEPSSFLQALIDIVEGKNYSGVVHAIPLLGKTGSTRAGDTLLRLLNRKASHQNAIIAALANLDYKRAALTIAKRLPIQAQQNDELAARYLSKVGSATVIPEVFRALTEVKRGSQIMRYVRILRSSAKQDAASADRLLGFFDNQKLDRTELAVLAATLAEIAPPGHKPTIERLKAILTKGDTGGLELQTAIALRILGDKTGPASLKKTLRRKITGKQKRNYLNHANLGEYYLEFGDYKSAVDAYKAGINVATGSAIRSMLYLQIARAQAKRGKWTFVKNALRDSKYPFDRLQKAATDHPEIAIAMQHDPVKKFMAAFGK